MANSCVENYQAFLVDRGGRYRIGELRSLATVRWSRRRNKTSTATITIAAQNCVQQSELIEDIEPGRHELLLYRGDERVWEGPIDEASWTSFGLTVTANDVFQYLNGTALTREWNYDEGEFATANMLERVRTLITHELTGIRGVYNGPGDNIVHLDRWENLDPPANILPHLDVRPGSVVTSSRTFPFEMMLGEHIQNLARSLMNYTTIGRRIIFWDSRQALSQTRTVTDNDFQGDLAVVLSGKNLSIWSHATWSQAAEDQFGDTYLPRRSYWSTPERPAWAGNNYYGSWERIVTQEAEGGDARTEPNAADLDALRERAQGDAQGRWPTPLEIRANNLNIILSPDLPISDLVPGVLVPIVAEWNLRPVRQTMLLDGISVTDEGEGETVQPTFIAAGAAEAV